MITVFGRTSSEVQKRLLWFAGELHGFHLHWVIEECLPRVLNLPSISTYDTSTVERVSQNLVSTVQKNWIGRGNSNTKEKSISQDINPPYVYTYCTAHQQTFSILSIFNHYWEEYIYTARYRPLPTKHQLTALSLKHSKQHYFHSSGCHVCLPVVGITKDFIYQNFGKPWLKIPILTARIIWYLSSAQRYSVIWPSSYLR